MSDILFKNKYRIPSARAVWWNYGNSASYFVTICTKNKEHFFGEISSCQFEASEIGKIAEKIWYEIPNQFPFIYLDTFVVMPNHIHGIILIDNRVTYADPPNDTSKAISELPFLNAQPIDAVQKQCGGFAGDKNPMLSDNLSKAMRWYKARVCFDARKLNKNFTWQPRFHDHIIRNESSYQMISEYIIDNPKRWTVDKFYI